MVDTAHGYRFGAFELNPGERRLMKNGEPLVVGPRAFDVLVALTERAGGLVTKGELLARVWPRLVVEENNLQVQVSALRKLLGSQAIATVPGRGYRLTIDVASTGAAAAPSREVAAAERNVPSIAVLPFVNMSDDATNEYFADGIAEELLNVLSKIRGLRVASHTSAFSFKGGNVDIPTVARKLNVGTILEGSVRKVGNRVRITAQLVDVASDSHLWSGTYDRQLDDIFAVQDDIAQSVVKELRGALFAAKPAGTAAEIDVAGKGRGSNAEAYRLYLQGRAMVARRTQASVMTGIEHLRKAVAIEPRFALAWAALSNALTIAAGSGGWLPFEEGYASAREAAQQALALEPALAEAHVALGFVLLGNDWDWPGAQAAMQRALALAPGNADVVLAAARASATLDPAESIALCRRAIALDPLNAHAHRYLALICLWAGEVEAAEGAARTTVELNPLGGMTYLTLGDVYMSQERYAEALAAFEKEPHDGFRLLGISTALHALRRQAECSAALEQLGELTMHGYLNAQANAYCGKIDAAFTWLEHAHAQRNAGLSQMKFEPRLANLRRDPRWPAFLRKMKLAD